MRHINDYINSFNSIAELNTYTKSKYGDNANLLYHPNSEYLENKFSKENGYSIYAIRIDKDKIFKIADSLYGYGYVVPMNDFSSNTKGVFLGSLNKKKIHPVSYINFVVIGDGFIFLRVSQILSSNAEIALLVDNKYNSRGFEGLSNLMELDTTGSKDTHFATNI